MKTRTLVAAAFLSTVVMTGATAPASAGQSCWGLQGQALQDCIDKLVKEISDIGREGNQSAAVGTVKAKKYTTTQRTTRRAVR